MRAVIQRVRRARVTVGDDVTGEIQQGLLILLGIHQTDSVEQSRWLAEKIAGLRIFEDSSGKMNVGVEDVRGAILVVSQFTLYGDCQKGRRPSFISAAPPPVAEPLYEEFINGLRLLGIPVSTGRFGADMQVELVNDGPVTLIVETPPF
jgi:D-aminoacyl-tRNA deacylase